MKIGKLIFWRENLSADVAQHNLRSVRDRLFETTTLRVQWPAGHTLALSALFLLLLFLLSEGFLRIDALHTRLATPTMASPHYQLGEKLRLLESFITSRGPLDCVAVGSSVVDTGFDPTAFAVAFKDKTGQEIDCFNYGVDAMPAAGVGALAEILVHDYQPDIVIYGIDPRDIVEPRDSEHTTVIMDTPWLQYRQDYFNFEGWLLDHFYVARYTNQLRALLVFNYDQALKKPRNDLTAQGQTPLNEVASDANLPPDADDDSFLVTYLSDLLAQLEFQPANLHGLNQIVNLDDSEVRVLIVVMPVADGYYHFFDGGREEYDAAINRLQELVTANGVYFLRPEPGVIPENGWRDYIHLNVTGAEAFSDWLGTEIGKVVAQSE